MTLFILRNFPNFPLPPEVGALLNFSLPQLVTALAALLYYVDFLQSQRSQHYDTQDVEQFDFIIVGGGSSGSVIANRLSVDYRVLLLEQGGDPHPLTYVPSLAISLLNRRETDWQFETVPQNNSALAVEGRRVQWPRGKGLGGSSNLNFMIYQRGHPRDFEQLADATGDPQWRYENLLPFFKKSENYHGHYSPSPEGDYHGREGPLYVGPAAEPHQAAEFLAAAQEMGYGERDLNAEQRPGFSKMDSTIKKGLRWSTYAAFLHPIRDRKNLVIYRYSRVIKIHLDKTLRAYGVSYVRHGIQKFVRAKREVVISAGAVDSPKLLLLSGIGPREHLRSVGIQSRVDLPGVGSNLQDHLFSPIGPFLINATSLLVDREFTPAAVQTYLNKGEGILASPFGISALGVIPSSLAPDKNWPDLYFVLLALGINRDLPDELTRALGIKQGVLQNYLGPHLGRDSNFLLVMLGKPKSRGELRLASADPWDKPVIQPNYFSHPDDMTRMVEGMRFILNLYENTTAFGRLNARLVSNKLPGCEDVVGKSDAYLECLIRHLTLTLYHPSGTCSMGKRENDPDAVVDSELRVRQVRGLRVADASVLRHVTNANLNAPAIVIGEKAAALIRQYWADQRQVTPVSSSWLRGEHHQSFYVPPAK